MTNVITLNVPTPHQTAQAQTQTLIASFAQDRRVPDDVFWLKENAELLNILECSGADLSADALVPHAEFYQTLPERLAFFPQYYRFLLSICLDLEDLGQKGSLGENLSNWIVREGLPEAELSDLQRAEARRLLARRGVLSGDDTGLTTRLHRFINRAETFALPNKKAAYELTHIVFYLSEYGRRNPELSANAQRSLRFAGVLAYLDQNADLLAEVCVAMRYAGQTPPSLWEKWVMQSLRGFDIEAGPTVDVGDDYHSFFVSSWLSRISDSDAHRTKIPTGRARYSAPDLSGGPLRSLSACMMHMQDGRSADFEVMRPVLEHAVDEEGYDILRDAEQSISDFDVFFAGFSRIKIAV